MLAVDGSRPRLGSSSLSLSLSLSLSFERLEDGGIGPDGLDRIPLASEQMPDALHDRVLPVSKPTVQRTVPSPQPTT
jgi:hypothetical protein